VSTVPYSAPVTADDGNGKTVSQTFNWLVNDKVLTVQGVAVNAVEGNDTGAITVATCTTPDLNSQAGDFTAVVSWGDGTTDTASISGGNGSFTVTDDHTYAEKGSFPVSVTISDASGANTTVGSTATVTDAALTLTGGFQLGDAMSNPQSMFTVASFTDANPNASKSDYTVSINWGDGNITSGAYVQSAGDGVFLIVAPHSYTLPFPQIGPLTETVTVTLTDADGASASTTSTVVVGQVMAGVPATMGNWVFQDANTYAKASDFVAQGQTSVALINWGDGTTSVGTVTGGPGNGSSAVNFTIQGTHTYAQDSYDQPNGQYTITVTATDVDGNVVTGTQYVSVVRPPLTLDTGAVETGPGLDSLTLTNVQVAAFTVPDAVDGLGEFSATIDWGDNSSSAGTIQEVTPGLFEVVGSHTYADYGLYAITVTVQQDWAGAVNAAVGAEPAQAGAPDKEITLTKIITAPDTPQKMLDQKKYRIPPGYYDKNAGTVSNLQPVVVKVGKAYAKDDVVIEVADSSDQNGSAVFDTVATTSPSQQLKVGVNNLKISGQLKTKETGGAGGGNAGKLYLRVVDKTTGKELARTEGFSVAAIPIAVTESKIGSYSKKLKVGVEVGMKIKLAFKSDSGKPDDINKTIEVLEKVKIETVTGAWAAMPPTINAQKNYLVIKDIDDDEAGLTSALLAEPILKNMTSDVKVYQAFIFNDLITGAKDIPIPQSGFLRVFSMTKPTKGIVWKYLISNTGSATTDTKLGIEVAAGITDPADGLNLLFDVSLQGARGINIKETD